MFYLVGFCILQWIHCAACSYGLYRLRRRSYPLNPPLPLDDLCKNVSKMYLCQFPFSVFNWKWTRILWFGGGVFMSFFFFLFIFFLFSWDIELLKLQIIWAIFFVCHCDWIILVLTFHSLIFHKYFCCSTWFLFCWYFIGYLWMLSVFLSVVYLLFVQYFMELLWFLISMFVMCVILCNNSSNRLKS